MRRWLRRILIAALLIGVTFATVYEAVTRVGRGWLSGEPFYDGRPASYWADELEHWETKDEEWRSVRFYKRASSFPKWIQDRLPETEWPRLLDSDPEGLEVLHWLSKHPSDDVRDWAAIGIERLDNAERGPMKFTRHDIVFTAQLYEVDEELFKRVGAKWRSMEEWEEAERIFLGIAPEKGQPSETPTLETVSDLLRRKAPLANVMDLKIKERTEGLLLSSTKTTQCLPTPVHVRLGKKEPQLIEEGLRLFAKVQISQDKRYLRVTFVEKSAEVEGIDKANVVMDNSGREETGELAAVKDSLFSITRTMPDGGTILLPLQYRSPEARQKGRWLVLRVQARLRIEEEERRIEAGK
jgi:hypothetical protein